MYSESYITDHLGNVRATFRCNAQGQPYLLQTNDFYPYGQRIKALASENSFPNEYLYQGKELDNENGLNWYDFHARLYDPVLGRWHTPDPAQQYVSPYMAMGNDPANKIDPSGKITGWAYERALLYVNGGIWDEWCEGRFDAWMGRQMQRRVQEIEKQMSKLLNPQGDGGSGGGSSDANCGGGSKSGGNGGGNIENIEVDGLASNNNNAVVIICNSDGNIKYITNNSAYVIYFKPEELQIINGKRFEDDEAYPLKPGEIWEYPVDGIKTSYYAEAVFKIPGKWGIQGDVTINGTGQVDLDLYGFGPFYDGWQFKLPAPNWTNLWNSRPYIPKK